MKFVAYAVAALVVAAAPAAQAAQVLCTLDLRGVDLTTDAGQSKAKLEIERAAEDYCGTIQNPQPLALRVSTMKCQAAVTEQAERHVQTRTQQALAKSTVLASR